MKLKYLILIIIIIIISYIFLFYFNKKNVEKFSVQNDLDLQSLLSGINKFYNETDDMLLWLKFDNNTHDSSGKNYDKSIINIRGIEYYDTIVKANDKSPSQVAFKFDGNTFINISNPSNETNHWMPEKMTIAFWIHGYSPKLPNVNGIAHQFGITSNSNVQKTGLYYRKTGSSNHRIRVKGTTNYIDIIHQSYTNPDIRILFNTPFTGVVQLEATPIGQTKWKDVATVEVNNSDNVVLTGVNININYSDATLKKEIQYHQPIVSTMNNIDPAKTAGWSIDIEGNGDLSFKYYISNKTTLIKLLNKDFNLSQPNHWNHFVYTYDGKYVKIYMNGKNVKTSDIIEIDNALLQYTTANLTIGAGEYQKDLYFLNKNTLLDDIRIYNRDLTETEINNIHMPNIKVDAKIFYQEILKSDDLQVSPNIKTDAKFEIWEDIVSNDKNTQRIGGPMLDNMVHDNNAHDLQTNNRGDNNKIIDLKSLYGSNTYTSQTMMEQSLQMKMQQQLYNNEIMLDDPINDAYLPYSFNEFNGFIKSPEENNNDYSIISVFKKVLDRNPTSSELLKYNRQMKEGEIDESMLKINLINSSEYRRNIKLQSNDVLADIEFKYAKEDLLSYISRIYFNELEYEIPKQMLLPLKDIFIYLQNNEYLFRALLIHENYPLFEKDVIEMKLLTKTKLGEYFEKYFILYDLKLSANDIKRHDILERKSKLESSSKEQVPPLTQQNPLEQDKIEDILTKDDLSNLTLNEPNKAFEYIESITKNARPIVSKETLQQNDIAMPVSATETNMQITDAQKNQDTTENFTNIIKESNKIFSPHNYL